MIYLKRFFTIGIVLLLVGVLIGTSPLSADPPPEEAASIDAEELVERIMNAPNPGETYAAMTPAEKDAVIDFHTPVVYLDELTTETVMDAALDGLGVSKANSGWCNTHRRSYSAYNSFGNTLWRYTSSTYFCYNGTAFIQPAPSFGTSAYTFYLWQFVGNTNTTESGGVGDWAHTDYAEGHFKFCLPKVKGVDPGCPIHNYPWIRKHQYGDGSWTSSAGV